MKTRKHRMKSLFAIIAFFALNTLQAMEKDSVLFSYGNNKVSIQEFIKVYKKSNLKKEDAFTEGSIKAVSYTHLTLPTICSV